VKRAVTSNPTPLQGNYAYKGKVDDTYECFQERTELSQNGDDARQFREGEENWQAFAIWLGPDFDINRDGTGAHVLFQHKPAPSDNPTSAIVVDNGLWKWKTQGGSPTAPQKVTTTAGPASREV